MGYIEIDTDLLLLAANPCDYNRAEILARLSNMNTGEKRLLRRALDELDELLLADRLFGDDEEDQ